MWDHIFAKLAIDCVEEASAILFATAVEIFHQNQEDILRCHDTGEVLNILLTYCKTLEDNDSGKHFVLSVMKVARNIPKGKINELREFHRNEVKT